jgi:hypothetical protein
MVRLTHPTGLPTELRANISDLLRRGKSVPSPADFGQQFGESALKFRVQYEAKYPNDYGRDPVALMQLVTVRAQLRTVLQRYGQRARSLMLLPTKGWANVPIVYTGLPGYSSGYGMLNSDTGDMGTGAYVMATHKSYPKRETINEAAWHYIWTNNGVNMPNGINVRTRPSRKGIHAGAPSMHFNMPYNSATKVGTFEGGTHSSGTMEVFPDHVKHNVVARNWVGKAVEELQPQFNGAVISAIIRGIDQYAPQIADSHKWKNK